MKTDNLLIEYLKSRYAVSVADPIFSFKAEGGSNVKVTARLFNGDMLLAEKELGQRDFSAFRFGVNLERKS